MIVPLEIFTEVLRSSDPKVGFKFLLVGGAATGIMP